MQLRDWIETNETTIHAVAVGLKRHESAVSRALSGRVGVSLKFVQDVHRMTDGEVSLFDWPAKKRRNGKRV